MTEKANPSINRPAEAYKTAGAIAYGGHGEGGFVSPAANPTDIAVQDSGITHANLNAFDETIGSTLDVTIDPGEAFVFGTWLAIDTTTTVTLADNTAGQTVYVGWNKNGSDDVIVGLDSAFSSATGDTDERIPIWTFDTSSGVVENAYDERTIGFTQFIEGKEFFGADDDFSISYNPTSDELEIVDEINNTVKASFDKNGDVHIKNGDLDLRQNLRDDAVTVYDSTNQWLPQARLENDSITIGNGDGITGLGTVALGDTTTVDVNVSDLTGAFLTDDGTNQFTVNAGNALGDDGNGNLSVLGDDPVTWTGTQTFNAGLDMGSNIDLAGTYNIKNAPEPADPNDLSRKSYVDGVAGGIQFKASVDAATAGTNVDLTSATDPNPIDGVTLVDGDRVLLKNQTDGTENGIYDTVTATDPTTWVRSADADEDGEVDSGMFTFVDEGTENGKEGWILSTDDPITLGTTSLDFAQFSAAGELTGGTAITVSSNQIDHADTSTQGNVSAPAGGAVTAVNLDGLGHVTSLTTTDFDGRFVLEGGDTMSGTLTLNNSLAADMSGGSRMSLPQVSSDPGANPGDMWYRTDLD